MTSGLRVLAVVVALAGLGSGAGCGDKGGADKFVGTWTYAGAINPNCGNVAPIDLTGAPVTITSTDSTHISVALAGYCTVNFDVDGSTATASSGQTCMFEIPGLGPATVAITKWTMTSSGDSIASDFMGSVAGFCAPAGTGTLTRASDGGSAGQ